MEQELKKIYQRFIKFEKRWFVIDAKQWSFSLEDLKIPDKIIKEYYDHYYATPFLSFLVAIKDIVYSPNVYAYVSKNSVEDWDLWQYLEFLSKEKIIKINKNGRVKILNKKITGLIPKPRTEEEIKRIIEKKLRTKIKPKEPVINLFKKFADFRVKAKWDQMPISQESAVFVVKKILDYLPLKKRFLFVGDDDFISILLSLVDPEIESLAIDIDDQLLESLDILKKRFNLKVETRKVDIRKVKSLGEKFVGFLTNPVYTFDGVKEFVRYGLKQVRDDGAVVFVEIGDESIGKRFLLLQEFFNRSNLVLEELINERIYYPYIELYPEDKEIFRRFAKYLSRKTIVSAPKLAASLYIFQKLPERPKRVKFKKPIYAFL